MDAAALLRSQGWRGKGHSLHPTDNSIGLSKPLLLSRNTDGRGVGQKQHFTSDQWWLRAFDEKLKGLDTSKNGVVQSVTTGALDAVTKGYGKYSGVGGLYVSFVRGGMLEGTITPASSEESTKTAAATDDRESSAPADPKKESKEERRARKEAKRLRKAAREERRARKEARKQAKAHGVSETREERRARRAEKRKRKEERRARKEARRKRREGKAARTAAAG
ncbi:hypothetical protein VTK73DRAFT_2137 [Phialemonium thermophilum]|uniref:G-patch domain-containing protein n=1 Tax=Phialemonium thermophilum TaxID=223376 RepID=A0ABR3X6M6_9PEZI